jgi:Icc-related predicted phosphoesterase
VRIVATSDCHGRLGSVTIPAGDLLVIAGDVLPNSTRDPERDAVAQARHLSELDELAGSLDFEHVVLVAGNHDWIFERKKDARRSLRNLIYLEDESIIIDGVKVHGSPWQPEFCSWAFNLPRNGDELRHYWQLIPDDVDVLVTHGPPYGVLDHPDGVRPSVGCELLRERVDAIRPRLHLFGHIHGSYGIERRGETTFANVSLCDEDYEPTQPPLVFEVKPR